MADEQRRWSIRFDHYDAKDERRREALLALGNGVLCWRASAPEMAGVRSDDSSFHYPGLYRAGWYDQAPREVNGKTVQMAALVNLPDPSGLTFSIDGLHWFTVEEQALHRYEQTLCLREAELRREIDFEFAGQHWHLSESRLVSMADPGVLLMRWIIDVPETVTSLWLRSILDATVRNSLIEKNRAYEGRRLSDVQFEHRADGKAALSATLGDAARRMAMALKTSIAGVEPCWRASCEGDRLVQTAQILPGGKRRLCIEKRIIVQFDSELPCSAAAARAELIERLPEARYDSLVTEHRCAWKQLWRRVSLKLEDAELERRLRLHVFHLLGAVSPRSLGHDQGLPPRTWQEGYYGQVFWDEMFAYPFLVTHFPELAMNLLRYRHRRLDVARQRARRAGLRGAMFPWRSAASGEEETPPFQFNPLSGRWMSDHTHLEWHVGSAIAYDAWLLYLATGDLALLANEAGELILEIARFWASVVRYDRQTDRYVIEGVIGPDEYHHAYPDAEQPGLNNNAYTNLMAAWTLRLGLDVLETLPAPHCSALRRRIGLTEEEPVEWERIGRRMYLPFTADGVLSQFDGFERLKTPPKHWFEKGHPRLDWMLEAKGDRADQYQLSKQADVLTLLHLFPPTHLREMVERCGYRFDQDAIRRTVDYHLSHITHESSLSKMACAGALAHLDPAASWNYFLETSMVDLNSPADSGTLEGVHLGAKSGSLDVLQRHYLGAWLSREGLHLAPSPPAELDNVEVGLWYQACHIILRLQGSALLVQSSSDNQRSVPVLHEGGQTNLRPGGRLIINCPR